MKHLFQVMQNDIDKQYETALLLTSAPDLYLPFGFRTVKEYTYVTPMKHTPVQGKQKLRKLDFFNEEDLQLVRERFLTHIPVSRHFAPVSHDSSFYLNMYSPYFQQKLYYSEELHLVLVYEVKGKTLRLYDCIGEKLPALAELCAYIPEPFLQVEFSFHPDLFRVKSFEPVICARGTQLMVRESFDIENDTCKLPETAAF